MNYMTSKKKTPNISKRKIGKTVGNNRYIHRSSACKLSKDEYEFIVTRLNYLNTCFNYNPLRFDIEYYPIIKFNIKENRISFIKSPDWDIASEPIVGDSILINSKFNIKCRKSNNKQIYHHKWMFVSDDYTGFDVENSKRWSDTWENHPHVLKLKTENKYFKSKIGSKEYFDKIVEIVRKG